MLVKCQIDFVDDIGDLAIGDSNFYYLTKGDFDKDDVGNSPKVFFTQ